MAQAIPEFNSFFDLQKSAFAPYSRFNDAALRTFERIVRHGYAVAGDVVEYGIAQLNAIRNAKDPAALVSQQSGLAADFVARETSRSNDFVKLATEAQAEFSKLLESVTEDIATAKAA